MTSEKSTGNKIFYYLEPKSNDRGWQFYSLDTETCAVSLEARTNIRSFTNYEQAVQFAIKVASFENAWLQIQHKDYPPATYDFRGLDRTTEWCV